MKVELTKEWCMNMSKREERADDAAPKCIWCEERVPKVCKSHCDTLTCEHRVLVPKAEVAQARQTAEYWKAEHLAGNARIGELHDELAATALRSSDHLRKAIKAEAEVALLRAALNGGNVIERLQFALQRLADAADTLGVNHFGDDWLSDEVQELQAATHAARLALGPNVGANRAAE